jgi:hypothetical protein
MKYLFSIALLFSFLFFPFLTSHSIAQTEDGSFNVRVESDQILSVEIKENQELHEIRDRFTAYVIPRDCLTGNDSLSIVQALKEGSSCSDSLTTVNLSQSGNYSFSPNEVSYLILGACMESNQECGTQPDQFLIKFMAEVSWQNGDTKEERILSLVQVDGD